jgi:hypothetical protein
MNKITIENIQEEFLKACHGNNKQTVKNIMNHNLASMINFTENDYEIIKIIEEKHPELLEFLLLKRKKLEGRIQKENRYIDANTYFYVLSEKSKKDSKLALSMLINGNEYLDIIPDELKTPDFLQKLSNNYEKDILDFEFTYEEKYERFLLDYIQKGHKFSKKIKLSENLLNNREFIAKIAKYPCNLFSFVEHLYSKDIEIMTSIALNSSEAFQNMSSKLRKQISQEEYIAIKLIEKNPYNFQYLNKCMQMNKNCIEKALSLKPGVYENFLPEIKNNESLTLELISKYNIDISFISDVVKTNKQIAYTMIQKNGDYLEEFPDFKNDSILIELALETSKKLSLIPKDKINIDKVKKIVSLASKEENSFNLHYLPKELKEDREFILEIIAKDLFFKEDLFKLINDYGNHKEDYEVIKECIKKHNDLYGRFLNFREDYEMIHFYIEGMKKQLKGTFNVQLIPQKIKAEASMFKISVDKYVFNKVLEKRSEMWNKDNSLKTKKLKI